MKLTALIYLGAICQVHALTSSKSAEPEPEPTKRVSIMDGVEKAGLAALRIANNPLVQMAAGWMLGGVGGGDGGYGGNGGCDGDGDDGGDWYGEWTETETTWWFVNNDDD